MAITYFALTSLVAGNCTLDDAASGKAFGQVRLWIEGDPPKATDIWVVVGEDLVVGDHAGLRAIKAVDKNKLLLEVQKGLDRSRASLADYGRSLGRGFHLDVVVPASLAGSL